MIVARSKTFLADLIRSMLPSREELEKNRVLRPVAHLLLQPALWRFTRRSVPRAIGLGLFVGVLVMIPFLQPLSAALIAIPFRANVPLTAGVTLLTNPVTTPVLVISALWVGNRMFDLHADPSTLMAMFSNGASVGDWGHWLLSSAAPALMSGLAVIATILGVAGYLLSTLLWRMWIGSKWRRRREDEGTSVG